MMLVAWKSGLKGLILGTLLGPEGANALSGPDTSVSLSDNRSENESVSGIDTLRNCR